MNVGVVGNGASAIISVISLLKKGVERIEWYGGSSILGGGSDVGEASTAFGTAYRTNNPRHLLNVEAGRMSPFEDRISFPQWLADHYAFNGYSVKSERWVNQFVPRMWYREYLLSLLRNTEDVDNIYRVLPKSYAHTWTQLLHLDKVLLCLGAKHRAFRMVHRGGAHVKNPWHFNYAELDGIPARSRIMIMGTGLTAIDTAISVWEHLPLAHIDFVSNHGEFPQLHIPEKDEPLRMRFKLPEKVTVRYVFDRFEEHKVHGWRSLMSTFRRQWNDVWTRMDSRQRKIFLKHYKHLYDVHRHKMVPQTKAYLDQHSYQVWSVDAYDWNVVPHYTFNATGISTLPYENDLLVNMQQRGICCFSRSMLGVTTNQQCKVVGSTDNVWLVGAYLKDTFWECTAIPDIKNHIRIAVEDMTQ